jgi:hypothetical protein
VTLKPPPVERVLQVLSVATTAFLIVYLLVYVAGASERVDCQQAVDQALITSVEASREADILEGKAMDDLLAGLLGPAADSRDLLRTYQQRRGEATALRVNNPLPDPTC